MRLATKQTDSAAYFPEYAGSVALELESGMNGWIYESPRIHSVSVEKRTGGSINHPNQGWVRFTRNREIAQRDGNKLIIVHCRRLDECLLFGAVAVALDELT